MTATSHFRGYAIEWTGGAWRFSDTGEPLAERPCPKCGEIAEPDGPDPCLGYIPAITSACCGHGVNSPYREADTPTAGDEP